jgi:hypothetical protein
MQFEGVEIYCNPGTYKKLNGERYICGCHPPVPYTKETFEKFQKAWSDHIDSRRKIKKDSFKIETVSSNSDPTKAYKLKVYEDGRIECDCKGYMFRKSCSHIEKYKKDN